MTGSAIGRVLIDGRDAGSGFAVTDSRALTAGHVVRPVIEELPGGQQLPVVEPPEPTVVCVRDRGEPGPVLVVEYQPEGAEPIPVTRVEVSTSLDVAVLHLQWSAPAVMPVGPVTAGAEWRVETRPKASDPALTGTVTDPHRRLLNQRGKETVLIQLLVREELGDYQGYSGSPVTLPPTGGMPGRVLGVLVEQGRWRISPQLGQRPPVANVLFAAPIDQVLTEFGLTGVTFGEPAGQIPLPAPYEVRRAQQLNRVIDALLTNPAQPPPQGQLVGSRGVRSLVPPYRNRYRRYVLTKLRWVESQDLMTVGPYTPELDEVFVDVSLISAPPHAVSGSVLPARPADATRRNSIDDFLDQKLATVLAVIGAPGSGKTVLLRHVARCAARARRCQRRRRIPILLLLRDHAERIAREPKVSLARVLDDHLRSLGLKAHFGWW